MAILAILSIAGCAQVPPQRTALPTGQTHRTKQTQRPEPTPQSSPELHWFYTASEVDLQEVMSHPDLAEDHFRQRLKDCVAKSGAKRAATDLTDRQVSDPRVWVVGRSNSGPVIRCMGAIGWAVR